MSENVTTVYLCDRCGCTLQGDLRYCVACHSRMHRPCPECMERYVDGKWHPKRVRKKGKVGKCEMTEVNCRLCKNQRYVLMDDDGNIVEETKREEDT